MLLTLFLLFTKHLVIDFFLQRPYQYLNKGTYGHPGGILHAGLHGLATWAILGPLAAIIDTVVHYHIDWAKIKLNTKFELKPDNSEKYWWLLGIDQYLHSLTYLFLIMLA